MFRCVSLAPCRIFRAAAKLQLLLAPWGAVSIRSQYDQTQARLGYANLGSSTQWLQKIIPISLPWLLHIILPFFPVKVVFESARIPFAHRPSVIQRTQKSKSLNLFSEPFPLPLGCWCSRSCFLIQFVPQLWTENPLSSAPKTDGQVVQADHMHMACLGKLLLVCTLARWTSAHQTSQLHTVEIFQYGLGLA